MQNKFSLSTNILRDNDRNIQYIPTANTTKVFSQVINDFRLGIRAFSIVGAYGTGKSSLLWAIKKTLLKDSKYFALGDFHQKDVRYISLVGEFKSLRSSLADYFNLTYNDNLDTEIFEQIHTSYRQIGSENPLLVLEIDEFGKFLEYAAKKSPEDELYFLQRLTEYLSDPKFNILFITTVHQNFEAYSQGLKGYQRQEWVKVGGRFKEIPFNEPVEQLLWLAAEYIKNQPIDPVTSRMVEQILSVFNHSRMWRGATDDIYDLACKLYPLDIVSAFVMTLALQKYGQNERSLFTFLRSSDLEAFNYNINDSSRFFNLEKVYDYLSFHFFSFLNSRANPDYLAWQSIRVALERVDSVYDGNHKYFSQIVKATGLLNLFAPSGSILDKEFFSKYSKICFRIEDTDSLLNELEKAKILLFRKYSSKYVLFEGTDLDIHSAIENAALKVSSPSDITVRLKEFLDLPPVLAKEVTYKYGTPRIFEYKISSYPIHDVPVDDVDGYINLIFNHQLSIEQVKFESEQQDEAIVYCYYRNSKTISDALFEIEKINQVIDENRHDKVALKELQNILVHQKNLLHHLLLNNYSHGSHVVWLFRGNERSIKSKKDLNKLLSSICEEVYSATPYFRNELVNRHKLSGSIFAAKRNYFRSLVDHCSEDDLGFVPSKFPPEKTIFLTMLKENFIDPKVSFEIESSSLNNSTRFNCLWDISESFLKSSRYSRVRISEFYEILSTKPYKLKRGFLDFWIPTFLFLNRERYALYASGHFVPNISVETLELVSKNPGDFEVKMFDASGVKYEIFKKLRKLIQQNPEVEPTNTNFISTLKPFFVFIRSLPDYAKNTNRLSKETLGIRGVLLAAEDPEKVFFEDFPSVLGISIDELQKSDELLENFLLRLQDAIRELRSSYDHLIQRFENFIRSVILGKSEVYEDYKVELQSRFRTLNLALLKNDQKVFMQRLDSKLDNREAWLNALGSALVGKSMEKFTDADEKLLYSKMNEMILDLDSLLDFSTQDFNLKEEKVLKVDVVSSDSKRFSKIVRTPLSESNKIESAKSKVKNSLDTDKKLNIAVLISLLKDLMDDEES